MDAIVLAAGAGRRMGGSKHLLEVGGRPLLARVLAALAGSRVREVTVVLRPGDAAGGRLAREQGARAVQAEDPAEGRAASIRAGVRATRADASGLLFAMADQPFLTPADFDALVEVFLEHRAAIVRACYARSPGTPVLVPARYREELLRLRGRQGGRVVVERHPGAVIGVELDPARGRDLDRPADLPPEDRAGGLATLPPPVERTLCIIKPDAVRARRIGAILERIEEAGLRIVAMRMRRLDRRQAEGFYEVHRERPFFSGLVEFMTSGPVVVAVLEGEDAIARYRELMGATNPDAAEPGTLRKLFATDVEKNAVHGSDGPGTAAAEVAYFFGKTDLVGLL